MSNTKMLQAVLDKVSSVDKKVDSLENKVEKGFKEVNKRLDIIGTSVACLEDDTPTIEELDSLEKRVVNLEHHISSN
jgi:ubiquinone biosynthesis protein UbiJ